MHSQCRTVEDVLKYAESELGAVSLANERASYGEWPVPESPADYLMWIEDEAEIQEAGAEAHPYEADTWTTYAIALRKFAADLRELGVTPSPKPWERRGE